MLWVGFYLGYLRGYKLSRQNAQVPTQNIIVIHDSKKVTILKKSSICDEVSAHEGLSTDTI